MTESTDDNIWDTRYEYYVQLADLLSVIAQERANVHIDEPTLGRWRDLMGIMREIDTFADSQKDSPVQIEVILEYLQNFDIFGERYPSIANEAISSDTRRDLLRRTRNILLLGRRAATTTSNRRLVTLRGAEAVQTAEIFADSASPEVLSQENFSGVFMPLLREMGVAACFLDSLHDADDDYQAGQLGKKPTIAYKAWLSAGIMRRVPALVRTCTKPRVLKEIGRAAKIHAGRRMHQRRLS